MIRRLLLATGLLVLSLSATAGTWGTGSFDNDDAADFLLDATKQADVQQLRSALERATSEGFLEAPDGAYAIASAEMVAAAMGKPTAEASKNAEVGDWVVRVHPKVDPSLAAEAVRALDRVLGDESELRQVWAESEEYDAWRGGVIALRDRIAALGSRSPK
ncbi:DUF4259 domain-containing protein [Lysobacter sp. KIS68-7]|uniref:DUF4259 domain-containing protein n=1 Tax=Lysobacter sp. KIS68-7 TaxID=2904252 RepID=UPI001E2DBB86|nr:DUF4259 domain-containing protein [Lysobacter sp. KIS68-7]UHQ18798.1 DUF4259 domain-containing protein [Lysobacter sp. KIS68-7]